MTKEKPTLAQNLATAERELRQAKRNVGRAWQLIAQMELILKRT